jgi:hypothetical protein
MKYLIAMFLLAACGREPVAKVQCSMKVTETNRKTFGTLEAVRCDAGDLLISATPNFIAGGVITSVEAVCGKIQMECQ